MRRLMIGTLAGGVLLAGCGEDSQPAQPDSAAPAAQATAPKATSSGDARFPDIRKAKLSPTGAGVYTLSVTVSSPYDTPERYADGWRVLKGGTTQLLGEHELDHDHASEQPFTRDQADLRLADGVRKITVQGRDRRNGYGGDTLTIDVPR